MFFFQVPLISINMWLLFHSIQHLFYLLIFYYLHINLKFLYFSISIHFSIQLIPIEFLLFFLLKIQFIFHKFPLIDFYLNPFPIILYILPFLHFQGFFFHNFMTLIFNVPIILKINCQILFCLFLSIILYLLFIHLILLPLHRVWNFLSIKNLFLMKVFIIEFQDHLF